MNHDAFRIRHEDLESALRYGHGGRAGGDGQLTTKATSLRTADRPPCGFPQSQEVVQDCAVGSRARHELIASSTVRRLPRFPLCPVDSDIRHAQTLSFGPIPLSPTIPPYDIVRCMSHVTSTTTAKALVSQSPFALSLVGGPSRMEMPLSRVDCVFLAKIADQAERYHGMSLKSLRVSPGYNEQECTEYRHDLNPPSSGLLLVHHFYISK